MADMNFGVHVLPKVTTTYNLGSTDKKWNNIYGTLKGNADTATKLATARSLKTKLDSTTAVTFDGSANQDTIPVTGTLPVGNGGTGATTFTAGNALIGNGTNAVTTRAILNNTTKGPLGWSGSATTAANLYLINRNTLAYWNGAYGTDDSTSSNLSILGTVTNGTWHATTIGIAYGGTGATTAGAAANNLLLGLPIWTANPTDDTYFIRRDTGGADAFGQVKASTIYNYIKGKTDNLYVKKAGDTMTGDLTVQGGTSSNATRINLNRYDGSVTGFVGYSKDSTKYGLYIAGTSPVQGYLTYIDTSTGRVYYRDSYNTNSVSLAYSQSGLNYADYTWLAGWNGYELRAVNKSQFAQASHSHAYLPLAGGTMNDEKAITFQITRKKDGGGGWAYTPLRVIDNTSTMFFNIGVYGSANTFNYAYIGANEWNSTANTRIYADGHLTAPKVYGAVWNDYAEYRTTKDIIESGRCVIETGKDDLVLSTERLQPGAEIVSDTFGFAIGETDEAKTPIATTGRVLAYIYEGREAARAAIGKPVCSGPDGTVSIMTDEEYQKYGYCAIGTISAVPDYEEWGTGKVKVNNRIWIRVR